MFARTFTLFTPICQRSRSLERRLRMRTGNFDTPDPGVYNP